MEVKILRLWLALDLTLHRSDAEKIRGYLGNLFWDNPYAHHHNKYGKLIYRYPCVQYKILDGRCLLIGFNEGIEIVEKVFHDLKSINLEGRLEEFTSKGIEVRNEKFSISQEYIRYSFSTPWLALNEKNFEKYRMLKTWNDRKELLKKVILPGNIISMSKSLGYTVPDIIQASIHNVKETPTSLKGVPMIGFSGSFSVNFDLPDYIGLGKSVSRGFGTIVKLKRNNEDNGTKT